MWLYPEVKSVPDLVGYYARRFPERTALIEGEFKRSFGDLNDSTTKIAATLARHVRKGANVAFLGKNSIEFWELMFGVTRAGCAILPLNWRLSPVELASIIEDAKSPLVFVEKQFKELALELQSNAVQRFNIVTFDPTVRTSIAFEQWVAEGAEAELRTDIAPDDTALLIYTSGTTGKPKGVQLSHQGFSYRRLCDHLEPAQHWRSDDVMLTVMPIFHFFGIEIAIQALYHGCPVAILPQLEVGQMLRALEAYRPTVTGLVPTAIQMLLDHPDASPAAFESLRRVVYGGSSIGMELLKRALVEMNCEFVQGYGATETTGAVMILRPEQHDLKNEARLKSCGTPLPLVEVKVLDPAGHEVPPGTIGEFYIRTPGLFEGYWGKPEATAEVSDQGWYRSGDAGYQDADGLFYVVDRVKDMIVTGAENVYSAEVEQALQQHPAVSFAAVVGVPDPRWGERVVAVVVLRSGVKSTAEELIAHCRGLIAGFKVPKEVRFATSLPQSGAGKILKRVLRDQLGSEDRREANLTLP